VSSRVIRVSAAVILDDDNLVLVVRKRGTTVFMQPGGKIDPDETPFGALQRELAEEITVVVTPELTRPLGRHVAAAANEPGHVVDAELFAVTLRDEPRPSSEIEELAWVDPAAPGDIELAPLTTDFVFRLVRTQPSRDPGHTTSASVTEM
jgi:8-oxo-dGTP pyrophosphatase MutT (NUDIX family)